ncbi:MAG: hypothetical protein HFI81_02000 [Eubacterium sp.]|jgi:fibronectin type 3 domain-containing protein|nr:hypothetical protein [Eubacterium sp.]
MRKIWNLCFLLCSALFFVICGPNQSYAASASAAAVSSNKIEVRWNPVEGAGSYAVYRSSSSAGSFQKMTETSATVYKDSAIRPAANYYYRIVPIQAGTGQEMETADAAVKAKTPAKTSIDRILVKSASKIKITWSASAGSSGYQVFRSESAAGTYSEIARIDDKTNCSFTDTQVKPGKTYYYKIRPTNKNHTGYGSYSEEMRGRTIGQVKIISIRSLSSNKMEICWKKVNNAINYEVYRSTSQNGNYKKIATLKSGTRKYTDQSVKSGKKYYYKVVAAGKFDGNRITGGFSEAAAFRALQQVRISSVKVTTDGGLKIKWSKVAGATRYKIYRASSKTGSYKKIATVKGASVLNYTDTKVISGKTYYYKVQAYSDNNGVVIAGSGNRSDAKGASTGYSIMGETTVTAEQMAALYKSSGKKYPADVYKDKGAKNILKFCEIVIEESEAEGVRAEVIFAQVCLETGYLSFGGQVSPYQCNFSGIGATDDGAAGATFPDVRTGLRAQVQHLKGYASTEDLNQACVDPRFSYLAYKRGIAKNVQDLGAGNWATDPAYAMKLMTLIKKMKAY